MPVQKYIDTRGETVQPVLFTEAVVAGLAPSGGLFVPEHIPTLDLDEILDLAKLPYARRASVIYKCFGVDLPDRLVDELMDETYGANFDSEEICPITSLDDKTHILELWHGPTSAFKDMALQCLPRFFAASAKQLRDQGKLDHEFLILAATSGDTGKAALEGFCNLDGVQIAVLYPDGGVSDIQYKQMVTQLGDNVMVWGVRGNFDDCQTAVKTVFNDEVFVQKFLDEHKRALSSANSINWGRLLPQVVYYVSSYAQLVADKNLQPGQELDVCVPTGNFGNILAAYYAKRMGVPIGMLFCASNDNRVLTDFINTGTYDIADRPFVLTPSPSMDILVSSNLERQLFELTGRNGQLISEWMQDLKTKKAFRVDADTFREMRNLYAADSVDASTCFATIKQVFEKYNYLLDPHTAVAYEVGMRLRSDNPLLIASTAHWAKFGESVYRALHQLNTTDPLPDEIAQLTGCELNRMIVRETQQHSLPVGLANLDKKEVRFSTVIDGNAEAVEEALDLWLKRP